MASFFDNRARAAAAKTGQANGSASASSSKDANLKHVRDAQLQPWVEKYRPKTLSDIASQKHTTQLLSKTLRQPNLPHLLFYGPPGTGKTSTVLALSKQLFGPELFRSRVLELNASDERGINVVRTKIKDFARQQLTPPPAGPAGEKYRELYPCPNFKIIVLDEADSMTQDAQAALRRTMEAHSRITRFCLICNYVTRIIDPLASRCSKFRFKALDGEDAERKISEIAAAENVRLQSGAAKRLCEIGGGDLRRCITLLQSCARLVGAVRIEGGLGTQKRGKKRKVEVEEIDEGSEDDKMEIDGADIEELNGAKKKSKGDTITIAIVEEIAGVIPDQLVSELVQSIHPNSKMEGSQFDRIQKSILSLTADGWSASQLVSQLYTSLIWDENISDKAKNDILRVFSDVDKRLIDGADEELAVFDLCLQCAGFVWKHKSK